MRPLLFTFVRWTFETLISTHLILKFVKFRKDQINTEEVYLSPDQNWLIEERHLKLYDVIRVTDYAVIPIPGNLKYALIN